jgi:UDP-2-acetamido-3-amino-2,3-dideoxy-glucuronate N-acetyltransferase
VSALAPSDRAPGLLLGPGVELPDDVALGGHVIIYDGVVIEPGCRIQDGAVIGKQRLVSPTARSAAPSAAPETVLERGAAVGCHGVIVAGARLGPRAAAGDHSLIRERVVLEAGAVVGSGSGIGPGCRIGVGSRIMPGALMALDTVIEEGVFCGPRLIVTNDPEMGRQGPGVVHPVTTLRRGCRIASNVTLLPGVEIGEEAVVGAGSLVTRSVPPRTVVVGAPARVLREVRDDELSR